RDFGLVVSKRFEVHEATVDGVRVQIYAFPEHRWYARFALDTAADTIRHYNRLFGKYPHAEFKIAESFFGWNGNETSSMVLIDGRIFAAPQLGKNYVDHLISHETCHQWWYSTVGTDGFRESWMDEGLVVYLTQLRSMAAHGGDCNILDWPKAVEWLPNISYYALQHNGYQLYRGRGGKGNVLAPLTEHGHVYNLFYLAYDRGSKVMEMIHHRLGDEQFFGFLRTIYAKYQFRVLKVEDFQRELELYTGKDWDRFFDDWLRSPKTADWKVDDVVVTPRGDGFKTTVRMLQTEEIDEPVEVALFDVVDVPAGTASPASVRLDPEAGDYDAGACQVRRVGPREWCLTFHTPFEPVQAVADPRQWILDSNPKNNRWKKRPRVRFTPLYNPIDEAPIAQPLDRTSFVWGTGVDLEGRIGLRGAYMYPWDFRVSPFVMYTFDDEHQISAGVDAEWFNRPAPNWSVGLRYEKTLTSQFFNEPVDQGKLFLRYYQAYTSSLIFPQNLAYVEGYFRFGDNFFPDEDFRPPTTPGVEDYRSIRAVGLNYHVDTQLPYWNPEKGVRLDLNYEHGFQAFGDGQSYNRGSGQLAAVHRLPDGLGWFSETRLAGRIAAGLGSPDNGEHFRFGGAQRFRGQRSEDTEGSAFWLTSVDWRLPLATKLDVDLYDRVAVLDSLYGSLFYDVGDSYIFGGSQGTDHALGAGLYFQFALFSFVEEMTLRLEVGRSLRHDTTIAWFGLYQAY
ncbi:MAG: M1 family aminopeptidase, partial [Planctomycetia bacterium]